MFFCLFVFCFPRPLGLLPETSGVTSLEMGLPEGSISRVKVRTGMGPFIFSTFPLSRKKKIDLGSHFGKKISSQQGDGHPGMTINEWVICGSHFFQD
jgi:hypothetical protein